MGDNTFDLAIAALAVKCPACAAGPNVWCFFTINGPDLHERRWRIGLAAVQILKETQ